MINDLCSPDTLDTHLGERVSANVQSGIIIKNKKNYIIITVTISVMLSKYSVSLIVKVMFLLQLTLQCVVLPSILNKRDYKTDLQ